MSKKYRVAQLKKLTQHSLVLRVVRLEEGKYAYEKSLKVEIKKIKKMKKIPRFFAAVSLLFSLINTIEQGFND